MDIPNQNTPDPNASGFDGFEPYETVEGDPKAGVIVICDHARNTVPSEYGSLGLTEETFQRHIAFDIGAEAVSRALGARLCAPVVLSTFSRLLIDPNRASDDPTLIMRLSDGAVVPGNRHVDQAERARRLNAYHRPYHEEVERVIACSMAAGVNPVIVSVHSFTAVWRGRGRPWHVGILWDMDQRVARPMIEKLAADPELVVGDNEPYSGSLMRDTLYEHATRRGLANVLVELRQDLIADQSGAAAWAEKLAGVLTDINTDPDVHKLRHAGSRTGPVDPI